MTTPFITERRSPLKFFLLVFALSIPVWLIGAVTPVQLLPGLPVSSLNVFCPLIAASILVYREDKTTGVTELLKRSFDYRRIRAKVWYIPTVLLMPGIMVLSYGLMRLMRLPLPTPQFPVLAALAMFLAFFIAALGEEVGWSGYVIDPLQDRWNALQASILLGLVWATWHMIPLVQAQRSPAWLAWWCLYTVALRVLIVWIYNNTGKSVFAAALCHAMANVSWQLFPNYGSHWDPRITGLITALVAVIVIVVWRPRTLARNRNG
jgi:membrane protease YdiL (CAAX protease family)